METLMKDLVLYICKYLDFVHVKTLCYTNKRFADLLTSYLKTRKDDGPRNILYFAVDGYEMHYFPKTGMHMQAKMSPHTPFNTCWHDNNNILYLFNWNTNAGMPEFPATKVGGSGNEGCRTKQPISCTTCKLPDTKNVVHVNVYGNRGNYVKLATGDIHQIIKWNDSFYFFGWEVNMLESSRYDTKTDSTELITFAYKPFMVNKKMMEGFNFVSFTECRAAVLVGHKVYSFYGMPGRLVGDCFVTDLKNKTISGFPSMVGTRYNVIFVTNNEFIYAIGTDSGTTHILIEKIDLYNIQHGWRSVYVNNNFKNVVKASLVKDKIYFIARDAITETWHARYCITENKHTLLKKFKRSYDYATTYSTCTST